MHATIDDIKLRTILLVEDEALIAMATKVTLENEDFRVITAHAGEEAIEVSRSGEEIDLILMDINLGPGIDGTQAAQTILRERDVPLVFNSSHTDRETVAKTEKITSYGYIVKSAGDAVLLASVRMAFRLHEANSRIRKSERQYVTLFDTITQGIIHHAADQSIISANSAAERILGLTSEQMLGKTSMDPRWQMIREDGSEVAGPDHPAMIALRTGATVGPVVRGVFHPDKNRHIWLRITAVPLFDETHERPVQSYATFEDISDERELLSRYQDLVDHLPGIVYTFSDQRGGLYCSNQAHQILGYDPAEIEAHPFLWSRSIHPDDLAAVREFIADPHETAGASIEYRLRAKDGSWILVHDECVRKTVTANETVIDGFVTDITERRRNQERLQHAQELNRRLFDQALSAIYIMDMTGRFVDVNEEACRQSGYPRDELLEMTVFDLNKQGPETSISDGEALLETWNRWEPGERYTFEQTHVRKDGTPYPVLISTGAIHYRDAKAIAAAVMDTAEQKRTQDELHRLVAERERVIQEIQHRIKNNINTLASLLSLQVQTLEEPTAIAAIDDARNRLNSLGVLYEHLYQTDATGEGSVRQYLTHLVSTEAQLFPHGERVRVTTDIEDYTCAIKTLSSLGLIVNELVTNAMKYAFRDHQNPKLTITGTHRDTLYILAVQDNGPGIPIADTDQRSSGFGLMIINALTEQLNATIRFENEGGTRAVLEFPIADNGCFFEPPPVRATSQRRFHQWWHRGDPRGDGAGTT